MPGWVDGFRVQEIVVSTPVVLWIKAITSRIRRRNEQESVEGHKVYGIK